MNYYNYQYLFEMQKKEEKCGGLTFNRKLNEIIYINLEKNEFDYV